MFPTLGFEPEFTEAQNYYYFQNGFSKEELNKIYNDVADLPFVEAVTQGGKSDIRSSSIKWIPQDDKWLWLYNKLGEMAKEANNTMWKFNIYSMPELIQYTEYYDHAEGHYGWHQDMGSGELSMRKISITVQLSEADEYEGGDLEFNKGGDVGGFIAPRGAGVVVIFPSYMFHRVTKVTKGTRRSFVLWLGGDHYR